MSNNRNTTLESLTSFARLLVVTDKESFVKEYKKATHDNYGNTIWYFMYEIQKKMKAKK